MRLVLNVLILVMLCGLLAGTVYVQHTTREEQAALNQTREQVDRFQRQVALQAALKRADLTARGYPKTIDPNWFGDDLPSNELLSKAHPWLEIAGEDDRDRHHPPDRVAVDHAQARFWYNPWTGVVRARVPSRPSDARTLEMYNFINGSDLRILHEDLP